MVTKNVKYVLNKTPEKSYVYMTKDCDLHFTTSGVYSEKNKSFQCYYDIIIYEECSIKDLSVGDVIYRDGYKKIVDRNYDSVSVINTESTQRYGFSDVVYKKVICNTVGYVIFPNDNKELSFIRNISENSLSKITNYYNRYKLMPNMFVEMCNGLYNDKYGILINGDGQIDILFPEKNNENRDKTTIWY